MEIRRIKWRNSEQSGFVMLGTTTLSSPVDKSGTLSQLEVLFNMEL